MSTTKIQPYSTEKLEQILNDIESDLVERKESFKGDAPNAVREAVCAFANDLPNHNRPGVVFIGVRDNGQAANLAISDELLRSLSDIKTDGAIGGHMAAVQDGYHDFRALAKRIAERCKIAMPRSAGAHP